MLPLYTVPFPYQIMVCDPWTSQQPSPQGPVHSNRSSGAIVLVQDVAWQREKDTGNFIILQ